MEWWHVYLFTRLDGVNSLLTGLLITLATGMALELCFFPMIIDIPKECKPTFWRWNKIAVATMVVVAILEVAMPTQKEAAAIYLLPKLAHSDFAKEAQQLPTDAAKLMRLKLESWISDMEPKNPEKK